MKKLLLLVFCCSALLAESPRVRVTVPSHLLSVVSIQTDTGACTGWVARKNVFVTAAHCFDTPTHMILAVFEDDSTSQLKLVYRGKTPATDFAILTGLTRKVKPLPFSADKFELPTMCAAIGYGTNRYQQVIPCMGSDLELTDPNLMGLRYMAADVDHGDSGGPVLVKPFNVAGIVVRMFPMQLDGAYIVSSDVIQDALKRLFR